MSPKVVVTHGRGDCHAKNAPTQVPHHAAPHAWLDQTCLPRTQLDNKTRSSSSRAATPARNSQLRCCDTAGALTHECCRAAPQAWVGACAPRCCPVAASRNRCLPRRRPSPAARTSGGRSHAPAWPSTATAVRMAGNIALACFPSAFSYCKQCSEANAVHAASQSPTRLGERNCHRKALQSLQLFRVSVSVW